MRTLGFRTHVLLALAAAVGVVAALARPWYAPAIPAPAADLDGPLYTLTDTIDRWLGEHRRRRRAGRRSAPGAPRSRRSPR